MKKISSVSDAFWHRSATFYLWLCLGVLLVIGLSVIALEKHVASKGSAKTDSESLIVRRITEDDHVLGAVSAPVQVIVYADLSCPYCKSFFQSTLPKLRAAYGDKIVVAYRHLPLAQHPASRLEANAAECVAQAAGNDAFWRFVQKVYEHPKFRDGLALSDLVSLAQGDGISRVRMSACIESEEYGDRVRTDALEASVAGISVTPGVVLKSSTRALIVQGDYHREIDAGIEYLLQSGI